MSGTEGQDKRQLLRARLIEQALRERQSRERVVRAERGGRLPLSWQQEALWFLHVLDPGSATYHMPVAVRLRGGLDVAALRVGLAGLIRRHEGLRTRFGSADGVAFQVVDEPPATVELDVAELSELSWEQVEELAGQEVRRPFDLESGWGVRWWLGRLGADDHVLVLTMHHIVTDGWSLGIMQRDLSALYAAARAGAGDGLPESERLGAAPELGPADFAVWQRGWLTGPVLAERLGFWRERLAGAQTAEVPADRPRPAAPSGAGTGMTGQVPPAVGARLAAIAAGQGASLLAVLTAGLLVVLYRYTGQDDLAVGSVFSGRTRSEIEPVVGYFANMVVLRADVSGNPSFTELVRRCNEVVVDALGFQDVPFAMVVDALRPERVAGRNPLFTVSVSMHPGQVSGGDTVLAGLTASPVPVDLGGSRFDLRMELAQQADGGFRIFVEYSTELYDPDRISRLITHFGQALTQAAASPAAPISVITLPDPGERATLDQFSHGPAPQAAGQWRPVHQMIADQAKQTPDRLAVSFGQDQLTYRDLTTAANQLARLLHVRGVGRGDVVGVCGWRSADLVIALLAVLTAGAAYVPLDPELPAARLASQASDARVTVAITAGGADGAALPPGLTLIRLDDPATSAEIAAQPAAAPTVTTTPDDLAYLIFTSGSTGTPKGAANTHGGLANRLTWTQLSANDVVAQKTPYTFDVSAWEFFWPLTVGARLAVAAPGGHRDFAYLARLLASEGVTVIQFVPSVLRAFLATPHAATVTTLRTIICGGEALPPDVRDHALATWPHARLHNHYGPTEAAIEVTAWTCAATDGPTVPIGTPITAMATYVLDPAGQLAPIGIPGELCLAGISLARGYAGRPALTAERFTPCPFGPPGQRMYRTGDLARWRPDGALDYLGRLDRQVKIHGQRIEPGDIEHALTTCPGITAAAVTPRTAPDGDTYLAAYITTTTPPPATPAIRAHLATRLPLHMIPATITVLPALPLTTSGKLNHAALPEPTSPHERERTLPATPTQQALATIWRDLLPTPAHPASPQFPDAHDNFFTLGGSSLDLVRLATLLRERFGVRLEPSDLYLSPTLAGVASAIDERLTAEPPPTGLPVKKPGTPGWAGRTDASLLPIRATGDRPPLFLVHAVGGSAVPYVPLTDLLDPGQPVYGIQAPGLDGGPTVDRLDELAERYLNLIRQVQPTGPYLLGGWSAGGAIALETAIRLRAADADVALLVLLDTIVPPSAADLPDQAGLLGAFCYDLAALRGAAPPPADLASLRLLPADRQVDTVLTALEEAGLVPMEIRDEVRRRFAVFAATTRAFLRYQPRPVDRPVTMLEAADNLLGKAAQWHSFAPAGLEYHVVPGGHHTMLRPPHLGELARTLGRCLKSALATARS